MEYLLSPRAQADIESIWDYTENRWGLHQAEEYLLTIKIALETVADNPHCGQDCEDIRTGYRKYAAASHVIFYRQLTHCIDVVRILHERMDFDRHLY